MVQVPPGVAPGGIFHGNIGGQIVAIQVPPGVVAGQTLQIQVPQPQQLPAAPTQQMIWEWDDDPQHTGKWVPYSQEQNAELNTALNTGTRTIYLHTLLGSYVIDLVAMT